MVATFSMNEIKEGLQGCVGSETSVFFAGVCIPQMDMDMEMGDFGLPALLKKYIGGASDGRRPVVAHSHSDDVNNETKVSKWIRTGRGQSGSTEGDREEEGSQTENKKTEDRRQKKKEEEEIRRKKTEAFFCSALISSHI